MKVVIAENSGVCFGVRRALNLLDESVKKGAEKSRKVVMLGALIHNPRVVEKYVTLGVEVKDIGLVPENSIVVVRSHGITEDCEISLEKIQGVDIVDTTCPYVKRIHQLVEKKSSLGYSLIVMGDKDHSEVQGITSRIKSDFMVVSPYEIDERWLDIKEFLDNHKKTFCVAQTTSRPSNYQNLLKKIRKHIIANKIVFDSALTICTATLKRQDSARELASRVDAVVVIGGRNSSNTSKLFLVVKEKNENSFRVESINDFSNEDISILRHCKSVGITAGASTPDDQIFEMKDFLEKLDNE